MKKQPNRQTRTVAIRRRDADALEHAESEIATGLLAYKKRNELICRLVADGIPQVAVLSLVNGARERVGAPTLTPDAISNVVKRAANDQER